MIPRTYDDWKTTNPEDDWLGDDPAECSHTWGGKSAADIAICIKCGEPRQQRDDALYDCDCCGKPRKCSRFWAYGIETFACDECRGIEEEASDEYRNIAGDR